MSFTQPLSKMSKWIGSTIAALGFLAGSSGLAHADTTAATDDKSVDVPTSWWTYTNQTTAQITTLLNNNQARLTDVEPYTTTGTRFTVTMVGNSGAYAVPGWWWYVDQTAAQIGTLLGTNNARLIDIEPYTTSAGVRFAAIMVSNTGASARNWNWGVGVSSAQIGTFLSNSNGTANPQRLTDLKSYTEGGVKKYVFIAISNTGSDAKGWEYWFNQSTAGIGTKVNAFGGRITTLERQSDGSYNFIQVKNAGADNHYWLYYFGLSSLSAANSIAEQYGSRVFDVETYTSGGTRLYNAMMIDNANSETRRIRTAFGSSLQEPNGLPNGQWGAYLKPLGSGATVSLNGGRRFEPASAIKAVHNLAVMLKVKDGSMALADALSRYQYPSDTSPYDSDGDGFNDTIKGLTKDACPNPADEIAANKVSSTVDGLKDAMMSASDNRATRAITLFFGTGANQTAKGISGIAAVETVGVTKAGMMDTFIDQPRIGCGYADSRRNQTTLADLGKLYEAVQNGTLLGTTTFRTEFFQPMNGGAFDSGSGDELAIRQTVAEEGASLGKTSSQIAEFISGMEWKFKPGGYGISCDNAFTTCTNGYISISSQAGRLTLPRKGRGGTTLKSYVFGNYIADLDTCTPGSDCNTCPECTSTTTSSATLSKVRKELFRSVIRENLATF